MVKTLRRQNEGIRKCLRMSTGEKKVQNSVYEECERPLCFLGMKKQGECIGLLLIAQLTTVEKNMSNH